MHSQQLLSIVAASVGKHAPRYLRWIVQVTRSLRQEHVQAALTKPKRVIDLLSANFIPPAHPHRPQYWTIVQPCQINLRHYLFSCGQQVYILVE